MPTLLLAQETDTGNWYVRFFQYDPETDSVFQPEESLEEAPAEAGIMPVWPGRQMETAFALQRPTAEAVIPRSPALPLRTGHWFRNPSGPGKFTEVPEALGLIEIKWTEVSFHGSGQSETAETGGNAEIEAKPVSPAGSESQGSDAEDGRIVFTGTVGTYSYEEVIALQGCPDPNAPWTDSSQTSA